MDPTNRKKIISFFIKKKHLLTIDNLKQLENEETPSTIDETYLTQLFIKITNQKNNYLSNSSINLGLSSTSSNLHLLSTQLYSPNSLSHSNIQTTSNIINNNLHQSLSANLKTANLQHLSPSTNNSNLEIKFSYVDVAKKREPSDFSQLFKKRFIAIEKILRNRRELQSVTSINRILTKKAKEDVAIIGLVLDIQKTKNGNIVLLMEDQTSQIKVIVNKTKPSIFSLTSEIVHDEALGITGTYMDGVIFATNILFPDIPLTTELKKSPDECYAAFISDIHIGSNNFMAEEFNKFISWLNLEYGSELHRTIAEKLKYIIIAGDLIDGVGIYPMQESELDIKDVIEQYSALAKLLSKIPPHIKIILSSGNHDAIRISEPQPPPYKDFAAALYALPNIYFVSNPAVVNIHKSQNFSGFDVLIYHGYSFDYYVANVDALRLKGGYKKGENILKFLLKKRHLAPAHSSTLYIPDVESDPLVIDPVPDFFATGHTHYTVVSNYRTTTLISGSCWQAKTAFQEKMGHEPQPCRVPIVNLQTRAVRILNFSKE
ncbi:DNA-directed DNA polymerase II small subunit [Candidatus Woesearchaeota archaeon]|nr:DNA-directed DNA polymerase II small subunit [Candidatus Woesearchaeota archaeon]